MTLHIFKFLMIAGIGAFVLSACVNQDNISNPSTQTGAAVGAVTGAVIGGNVGNVGDGSGTNIAAGAVLGSVLGGATGNAVGGEKPKQTGGWE